MFIQAKQTGKREVTFYNKDGSGVIQQGGNWTWRNQNPGNIGAGAWANRHGAIGKAGAFAIFPDYDAGKAAIFDLLQGPDFKDLTIWAAIPRYAPTEDNNDVERYRKIVAKATGLDLKKKKIKDLTKAELKLFVDAIERVEGKFKSGKVTKFIAKKKITSINKNKKGTIISYYVKGIGWISKEQAIELTSNGKIDAVVSHSRAGNPYIKTRPDWSIENNLEGME
jgi:hypothetical protein